MYLNYGHPYCGDNSFEETKTTIQRSFIMKHLIIDEANKTKRVVDIIY